MIFDCHLIPESAWSLLDQYLVKPPSTFIIECIRLQPAPAHYGFAQAMSAASRVHADKTYFVQLSHGLSHKQLEKCCEAVQVAGQPRRPRVSISEVPAAKRSTDNAWAFAQTKPYSKHPLFRNASLPRVLDLDEHDDEIVVELALQEIHEVRLSFAIFQR